jgi:tRNA nucleotidyltransferase (CCA-adding enzyme)
MNISDQIPEELAVILRDTPALSKAYLVGGCVRDALLGASPKDFDIETFGVSYDQLSQALSGWGRIDLVGRSFGVIKLTTGSGHAFDFTIPRRDSKVGPGHTGFEISFDPAITPRKAAERRDFTINALMFDPRAGQVLDFVGGVADLQNRILRHVSPAFSEDPLRVLRGMQFAARFGLTAAPETLALCRQIKSSFAELAVERVREEWFKWAGKSTVPSAGLHFLVDSEWAEHFPEVLALRGTPQEPEWHPEGDVFIHTCHCCDALATLVEWKEADVDTRIVLMLAVLAHDFAKPQTTHLAEKDGRQRLVSPGHDEAGGPLALQFLERMNAPMDIRERVVPLVTNHLAHLQALNDRAVRRLARRLAPETIEHLCVVITADQFGRPPRPREVSENLMTLRANAAHLKLEAAAPRPILMGRHLIVLGLSPGPRFSEILSVAFDAQIDGAFQDLDGALHWLISRQDLAMEISPEAFQKAREQFGL